MDNIPEYLKKIKSLPALTKRVIATYAPHFKLTEDLFIAVLIILVALISFGLGKVSALEKGTVQPTVLTNPENIPNKTNSGTTGKETGTVLASKSGTRYYFPSCSGASRIKDENKIWFATEADAQAAGLAVASGCTQ